jgi:transglutaminase-like putative cysteine protease
VTEEARRTERICLYIAALAAGSAFSILFTGEGGEGVFDASSLASIGGGGAFVPMFGAALAALLVGSAGRFRFVLLFPAAVLYTLFAVYGFPPLTFSGWGRLIERIGADLFVAANTMYAQPVPYDLSPGLLVILVPMVMVIVAFATSATLYERTPIISVATLGLTIGVLSTISFEDGAGPFFFVFVLAALALLLFSGAAGESGNLLKPGLFVAGVVAAVVLLAPKAPFSDQTVSSGEIDWTRIGTGGTSRLDVQADVGDYLTAGRDAELMRVSSTEQLRWRGGTLDRFDGVRWTNTTRGDESDGEEVAEGVPTRPVVQSVQILDAETDLVFGGYKITDVSNDVLDATENPDGSWTADSQFSEGDFYRVLSEVPQPTTEQLQGAGTRYPVEVRERFLQLPETTPGVVGETADQIMADYDPSTPYEAARAVERYLTTDGDFVYNLDVSYRRADWAIEEFLGEGREGFCTQFATSMALILRDMDIPSRVVYGATPGEEVDENVYEVTGANMHTWVEVYFPGVGWYPMDPTPGFAMPETMQANAPSRASQTSPGQLAPENPAELRETDFNEQETPEETPEEEEPAASGSPDEGVPAWPLFVLVGGLLLAVPPVAKRMLLARGRPEDFYRDLSGRLRDVLPPGGGAALADSPSLTVNERMALLAGACGLDEKPFTEFGRAYSDHLYGPEGGADRRRVSRSHRRAVREFEKLPPWRRMLGAVNPASLAKRLGRKISSGRAKFVKGIGSRTRRVFRR